MTVTSLNTEARDVPENHISLIGQAVRRDPCRRTACARAPAAGQLDESRAAAGRDPLAPQLDVVRSHIHNLIRAYALHRRLRLSASLAVGSQPCVGAAIERASGGRRNIGRVSHCRMARHTSGVLRRGYSVLRLGRVLRCARLRAEICRNIDAGMFVALAVNQDIAQSKTLEVIA